MSKASNLAGFVTSIVPINNLNVGVVTTTSLYGDGSGLTGISVGVGSTENYTTSGIITAGSFYGDGGGLINIGGALEAITYSPGIAQTNVSVTSNIAITFNKPIKAGVGTITLRTGSAAGPIVESFDISSSDRLTFNSGILTIDPTNTLAEGLDHYVVFPANVLDDAFNTSSLSVGISSYYFTTEAFNYTLFSWALNDFGQLGQAARVTLSSPIQIPGTNWSSINGTSRSSFATKTDGTLWAWGRNISFGGNLGQNNTISYSSPVQIPGTTWSSVSSGAYHTLATKTDGTLWAWGYNASGELGLSDRTTYSSPRQIPGTTWKYSGVGNTQSIATKTDGTLWAWGSNAVGELGQNNKTYYSSPVQIPGTTWNLIVNSSAISNFFLATKSDGTLWAWGSGGDGQLGQNNGTSYSSPRQIPGTTWSSISSGNSHSLATKTDGTLWVWGSGNDGKLGQNNTIKYSSPIQIPGTTWNSISGGVKHSVATKSDGTLWSWGYNSFGQLGQDNDISKSSPVQIPGTTWSNVTSGNYHVLAIKQEPQ